MLGTNGIGLIMFRFFTTKDRIVDQYAKQTPFEKLIPDGVDILWFNLDGCTSAMFEEEPDIGFFKWFNTKNIYLFIDGTKECSELGAPHVVAKFKDELERYDVNEDHVYWITGNPHDKKYVKHHIYWEMFLTAVKEMMVHRTEVILPKRAKNIDPDRLTYPSKKFICYNGRYRQWRKDLYTEIKNKRIYVSQKSWKQELLLPEFTYTFQNPPTLEEDSPSTPSSHDLWNVLEDVNYLHEFWLVTETVNHAAAEDYGHIFLTEKTFKPILLKMGFLIAGQPGALKKLRDLGFKTFSDYWDESYDNIIEWTERKKALVNTIRDIILNDVHVPDEILQYNYDLLKEHKTDQKLKDTLSNLTPI